MTCCNVRDVEAPEPPMLLFGTSEHCKKGLASLSCKSKGAHSCQLTRVPKRGRGLKPPKPPRTTREVGHWCKEAVLPHRGSKAAGQETAKSHGCSWETRRGLRGSSRTAKAKTQALLLEAPRNRADSTDTATIAKGSSHPMVRSGQWTKTAPVCSADCDGSGGAIHCTGPAENSLLVNTSLPILRRQLIQYSGNPQQRLTR